MSFPIRTRRGDRGPMRRTFRLNTPTEATSMIQNDLAMIGKLDREPNLRAVLQEQIEKAEREYNEYAEPNSPSLQQYSADMWQRIAGNGPQGLRSSKPMKDGRAAYVWRWMRLHTGADVHMPVTADFDLSDEVDREVGYSYREMGFDHPLRKVAQDKLDREKKRMQAVIDYISAVQYPVQQFAGALRWSQAGLF